jgi:hypothetical protein
VLLLRQADRHLGLCAAVASALEERRRRASCTHDGASLRHAAELSIRQIKASTKVSVGAIQKLLTKADALGLTWPLPAELDDNQLARLFFPSADTRTSNRFQVPDWSIIHQELKRKGVTKQLLWEEYTRQYPSQACGGATSVMPKALAALAATLLPASKIRWSSALSSSISMAR